MYVSQYIGLNALASRRGRARSARDDVYPNASEIRYIQINVFKWIYITQTLPE